jgi:hypothetical protein
MLKDKKTKDDVAYFKAQNEFAKELVAAPINVKIQNLGDSINSEFPDYSPVLSADESSLIYTTRRNTGTGGERLQDGQYYEDIVISYKDANGCGLLLNLLVKILTQQVMKLLLI